MFTYLLYSQFTVFISLSLPHSYIYCTHNSTIAPIILSAGPQGPVFRTPPSNQAGHAQCPGTRGRVRVIQVRVIQPRVFSGGGCGIKVHTAHPRPCNLTLKITLLKIVQCKCGARSATQRCAGGGLGLRVPCVPWFLFLVSCFLFLDLKVRLKKVNGACLN